MSDTNDVGEKREKFDAKQKLMGEVIELAGARLDFSKKELLTKLGAADSNDATRKFQDLNLELEDLGRELKAAETKAAVERFQQRQDERSQPWTREQHPIPATEQKQRTFGDIVINLKEYKAADMRRTGALLTVEGVGIKTLMETSAGFAPEAIRTGLLVEAATRPIQVLDLIPTRPISQNADKYMEETTRTHSAAEKGEGVAYAESVFVWTERTQLVEKITDSIPVTDEQLEDAPQVAGLLNSRLSFGLRQRLDLQVLVGDGSTPNLKGILDHSVQTQAKGGDPTFDATYKALTKVRVTGRAFPSAFIFHPNDWQDIRLTRTADGQYIMGHPSQPGATTLWGLPVAVSDAITENTGLTGDFSNFCYISERRGIEVAVGYVGDQFKEGKRTIRADLRCAMTVTRAAAFATITGI
jgi:HK97 family phage major capsid protein